MNILRPFLKTAVRVFWTVAVIGAWPGAGAGAELTEAMKKDALKIQRELDRIEVGNLTGRKGAMKSVQFTEAELNAWLAYRIEDQKEDVLRELALKLFPDNRIEGKAFVDLSRARLPLGLKPKFNLYFAARVRVEAGAAKIEFERLFLDGQQVPIPLLDLMIAAAAGLGKSDAGAVKEWVPLPYGLKDLRSDAGRVRLYY
jgi:hypothetical protein